MTTHTSTHHASFAEDRSVSWASGLVMFAGIMMLVAGVWHALAGIAALVNDKLYISTVDYVYSLDLTSWGWAHLVLGSLVAITGGAVLAGIAWARVLGIVLVVVSLVANFLFIPWYPIWSLVIIALDVAVIWALAAWPRQAADS
jgi:hypothetical protein